jgi:hypothetical protein
MDQMLNLGSLFHINGPHAREVPDMLRRFSSQPIIGRLAVAVGWRRGDSASLMADSTSGQAVALLSTCLVNLFDEDDAGIILHMTCDVCLSETMNVAIIMQLRDVTALLASKLHAMGFGNHLAEQIARIRDIYEQLQIVPPDDLLCPLAKEAVVDLLASLSRVHSEDSVIVRITGSAGMGYIIGLVLDMFPDNTLLTVESFVVHEGPHRSILLELTKTTTPIQVCTENGLTVGPIVGLPIEPVDNVRFGCHWSCRFTWRGWIADELRLWFSSYGASCTPQFLVASSNLLVAAAPETGPQRVGIGFPQDYGSLKSSTRKSSGIPKDGIQAMLGQCPRLRTERICETVLRAPPSGPHMNVAEALSSLVSIFEDITKDLKCKCGGESGDGDTEDIAVEHEGEKCRYGQEWRKGLLHRCPRTELWTGVTGCLNDGALCLLVEENVGPNVSVRSEDLRGFMGRFLDTCRFSLSPSIYELPLAPLSFLENPFNMPSPYDSNRVFQYPLDGDLARSSGSTTIFPGILWTLEMPAFLVRTFELLEGKLLLNGYQFLRLICDTQRMRDSCKASIFDDVEPIIPSNCGVHSDLRLTVKEKVDYLTPTTTIRYSGRDVHLPLHAIVEGCYNMLFATEACNHPPSTPLEEKYRSEVIAASVVATRPLDPICIRDSERYNGGVRGDQITFAMTQGSPTAQLLACNGRVPTLLVQDCCLNCAFEQAKKDGIKLVVVT